MKPSDRDLGMGRGITRRDFVQGVAAGLVAGSAIAASPSADSRGPRPVGMPALGPPDPAGHPPERLGLRGSHPGSFEVAHERAWNGRTDFGPVGEPDADTYDLVVVGAGVSGLSAAYFWRQRFPDARVLLLENHDDFGGHAKRNEFQLDGRTLLGYGGSQTMEQPDDYSDVAKGLLAELSVDLGRFDAAYDQGFFRRHGLRSAVYFDREGYGVDRVVPTDLFDARYFMPLAPVTADPEAQLARMPLSEAARAELLRLWRSDEDALPGRGVFSEPGHLSEISYLKFLTKHVGVREPEVIALLQHLPDAYFGHGIDVAPAIEAMLFGLPGLRRTSLGRLRGLIQRVIACMAQPYIHHFPDGNASIARLLVRRLIPGVAAGSGMEDVVTARFDYEKLDRAGNAVRLRLGSTVVRVEHEGAPGSAERVGITYVRGGRAHAVRARHVVLACYNVMIPHLCPELPGAQGEALRSLVKTPLVYTSVLLRSWRAFAELGVGLAYCPGSWHRLAMIDFPVSLSGYRFTDDPGEPVMVHMQRCPTLPGRTPQEQSRAGRHELLGTSFETIERGIRTQLAGMLGSAGFDPAREIAGIAVNRWPHGYAFGYNPLFDPEYPEGQAPHEIGRRPFGRVAIANSDAGARAYLDCAIDQAWRAVGELAG